MQPILSRLKNEINIILLARALLVLAPLIIAASITGKPIWLRAGIVTISTFIGMERSGLAPLGILLHALAIITGFMLLLFALMEPPLFVLGCTVMRQGRSF